MPTSTPGEVQSQLQGEAPKNTSVVLSVNEVSVSFTATDSSGKDIGSVVLSRDEYRAISDADLRKKLFGDRKPATFSDRKDEDANQTASARTAEKLGIQESVLRQKANQDKNEREDKKEVAEKGIVNKKIEDETGKKLPKPPERPHTTNVVTPNPAEKVHDAGATTSSAFNAPLTHEQRTTTPNPGTITHNFKLNEDPRKVGEPARSDVKDDKQKDGAKNG
jgi:hypothetical protein